MIKIPYEQLLEKIQAEKGMAQEDIEKQIQAKMDQLSGLISREGAAHILANELGVKLTAPEGKIKIKQALAGMRNIELVGKILKKFDVREFKTANREGKVGSFVIGDETGTIRITCWNDQTDKMLPLQENDVVKLEDGYVRENRGALEIHLNEKSTITQNPEGVTVEAVQQAPTLAQTESKRKTIKELQENDNNIEILGTIVQVFTMNFYERCPQCRKRVREPDFQCGEHGIVEPQYAYVMNCYLDDGSANIRTVFFSDQIQQLTKKTDEDIQTYRTAPENFEQVKTDLLGEMVKVVGRTTKNQMFDRIEFVVNHVDRDVNPEEEIARLQKELETKA